MLRTVSLMLLLAIGMMIWPLAQAVVYKWTDEHGRVHYSDQPQNQTAKSVELSQRATKTDIGKNRSDTRRKLLQAIEEDRLEKQQQQRKQKQQARYRKKQCALLRDKLRRLNRATGVYRLNDKGERVFLSAGQRDKSVTRLKKQISQTCR